jgi:hypothetical protein
MSRIEHTNISTCRIKAGARSSRDAQQAASVEDGHG